MNRVLNAAIATTIVLLCIIAGIATASADIGDEIFSLDDFQKRVGECFVGNQGLCFKRVFLPHMYDRQPGHANAAKTLDTHVDRKISEVKFYRLHMVRHKKAGDILDERIFLMEFGNHSFAGLRIVFLKRGDRWYLNSFKFDENSEVMTKMIGIKL